MIAALATAVLAFWVGRRAGFNAGARWAAEATARQITDRLCARLDTEPV